MRWTKYYVLIKKSMYIVQQVQGAPCAYYITFEFSRAFACQQVQNNPLLEIVIFAIGFDIVINCIKDV